MRKCIFICKFSHMRISNEKSKQLIEMQLLTHGVLLENRTTNIFVYSGKGVKSFSYRVYDIFTHYKPWSYINKKKLTIF